MVETEDVVLWESRPLSELLFLASAVSSAASIDMSKSSSGTKHKNTESDVIQKTWCSQNRFGIILL